MVFGTLSNLTDGAVLPYIAVLVICLIINDKITKTGAWILSGSFALFQLYLLTVFADAEQETGLLMILIFVFAVLKCYSDITNRNKT